MDEGLKTGSRLSNYLHGWALSLKVISKKLLEIDKQLVKRVRFFSSGNGCYTPAVADGPNVNRPNATCTIMLILVPKITYMTLCIKDTEGPCPQVVLIDQ